MELPKQKEENHIAKVEGPEAMRELASWRAREYVKYEKDRQWYVVFFVFLAIMVGLSIWPMKNILMAFTFILAAAIYLLYSKKEPREIDIKILESGLQVDDTFYDFEELKSFWIFYNNPPSDAYLSIKRKSKYLPTLEIPIEDYDPVAIREVLIEKLKEKKQNEELSNIITRILKI
ncbi:MAG: hypothetical protein GF347_05055 [Candidatus Moranbacteria bacterium]|nr:hypothetical protein [Candidatus Moranbacteria bacterium]